jgi:Flp pilus assembly protein TadD
MNLDVALQLAQTAKQELPDVTGVTDTLGWVYYKKKLSAQAVAAFDEIARAEPQNAIYQYHLGLAYTQTGDTLRARRALEQAVKLQPNSPEAADARRVLATLPSAS